MSLGAIDSVRFRPSLCHGGDDCERCGRPFSLTLLKIALALSHRIRHMRKAHDALTFRSSKLILGRGLHLNGEHTLLARRGNGDFGLAVGGICRPTRATMNYDAFRPRNRILNLD